MTTTDMGSYGTNTPMYLALDGLTVNTEHPTNTQDIYTATSTKKRQMIIINSHLTILSAGELYTLFGQRIKQLRKKIAKNLLVSENCSIFAEKSHRYCIFCGN